VRLIYEENQKTLSGYDVVPVELIDAGDKVVAVAQAVGAKSLASSAANVATRLGASALKRSFKTRGTLRGALTPCRRPLT
jgi:hypothetical protein